MIPYTMIRLSRLQSVSDRFGYEGMFLITSSLSVVDQKSDEQICSQMDSATTDSVPSSRFIVYTPTSPNWKRSLSLAFLRGWERASFIRCFYGLVVHLSVFYGSCMFFSSDIGWSLASVKRASPLLLLNIDWV